MPLQRSTVCFWVPVEVLRTSTGARIRPIARLVREAVRRYLEDPQKSLELWEGELCFMDRWTTWGSTEPTPSKGRCRGPGMGGSLEGVIDL